MSASDRRTPTGLKHFRVEIDEEEIAHLIFDMAGSPVNVLSQATIGEIGIVVNWFENADVSGLILRSAKQVFCAGGDLAELGAAYDRIAARDPSKRFAAARAHFAPMNEHLLRLERCSKPVAAVIAGAALGGGFEFALAAHHRVAVDNPSAMVGLPEVPIGLMPGAGGTQRLPRLIGVEAALPILLEGLNLAPDGALAAGIVDEVVAAGTEIAAARSWILSNRQAAQPRTRRGWKLPDAATRRVTLAAAREGVMLRTAGNYPAPLAVLASLDQGLELSIEGGIGIEIDAFAELIQRPEPRNMIRAMFIGAQAYSRRRKTGDLPPGLDEIGAAIGGALGVAEGRLVSEGIAPALIAEVQARLGFSATSEPPATLAPLDDTNVRSTSSGYWFEDPGAGIAGRIARTLIDAAAAACAPFRESLPERDHALVDHAAVRLHGFPAWSGGPIAWLNAHSPLPEETEIRP